MTISSSNLTLGAAALAACAIGAYFTCRKPAKKWKKVGKISKLFIYPLKSAAAVEVANFHCKKFGPAAHETTGFDRAFFIMDEKSKSVLTARQDGRTLLIHTKIAEDQVIMTYKNHKTISVKFPTYVDKVRFCKMFKKDVLGIDCGDEAAEWLKEIFEKDVRLVYYPHLVSGHETYQRHLMTSSGSFVAAYQDEAPFNILSEASVTELNSRLDKKVSERNFRTNILVNDCKAFEEDTWMDIRINGIEFKHIMRSGRCLLTTVDPDTGVKAKDFQPLKTLRKFRQPTAGEKKAEGSDSPKFGNHLATDTEGIISVGDDVYCLV